MKLLYIFTVFDIFPFRSEFTICSTAPVISWDEIPISIVHLSFHVAYIRMLFTVKAIQYFYMVIFI